MYSTRCYFRNCWVMALKLVGNISKTMVILDTLYARWNIPAQNISLPINIWVRKFTSSVWLSGSNKTIFLCFLCYSFKLLVILMNSHLARWHNQDRCRWNVDSSDVSNILLKANIFILKKYDSFNEGFRRLQFQHWIIFKSVPKASINNSYEFLFNLFNLSISIESDGNSRKNIDIQLNLLEKPKRKW